jgi:hypothetical protein
MTPDNEADLRWYFTEAHGACGVRSPLGAQLDMLRQGTLPGKHERRREPDISEAVAAAGHRANRIAHRLNNLTRRDQLVLELHFGAAAQLGGEGVSVALACWTPAARAGYKAAVRGAKSSTKRVATIRLWLMWVAAQGGTHEALVDEILEQARKALAGASGRYEVTR